MMRGIFSDQDRQAILLCQALDARGGLKTPPPYVVKYAKRYEDGRMLSLGEACSLALAPAAALAP